MMELFLLILGIVAMTVGLNACLERLRRDKELQTWLCDFVLGLSVSAVCISGFVILGAVKDCSLVVLLGIPAIAGCVAPMLLSSHRQHTITVSGCPKHIAEVSRHMKRLGAARAQVDVTDY
jgi:hypothetical protein